MAGPKRVILALGSGGARGYAHVGVIRELQARGFEIAGVAGSSMGALVGGVFAAGKLEDYADWATTLNQLEVVRLLDPSFSEPGAIRAAKILGRIREILGDTVIEELPIPYTAVATDLTSGRSVWFQHGPVETAIRASIAIPGVISPLVIGDRVLADGGILDPLPVVPTLAIQDADITIGVSLTGNDPIPETPRDAAAPKEPGAIDEWVDRIRRGAAQMTSTIIGRFGGTPQIIGEPHHRVAETSPAAPRLGRVDLLNRSLDVMQAALTRHQLAAQPPDLLIEIPRSICRTLDFHRAADVIAGGREITAAALDAAGLWGPTAEAPTPQHQPEMATPERGAESDATGSR
ncbi:patatin-like phospholipase family protein [Nocardia jiangxiensis]|uniref:Patatin-like phospholipase family protein n=1 Tax=Nocardia jiangxiensis TaxID=282685 RepID=A0ABW6S4Z2_9NOCA|nr:patatin-like phospholipase family protein [Nocardia jiangxiensis]